MTMQPVRVRFAPSPTGFLHIGGARTALYNYLLARQTGGSFVLRIEDTDQERLVPGAFENMLAGLRWLGLQWDEGPQVGGAHAPYVQSERAALHRARAEQLVLAGQAYHCFCTRERLDALRTEQRVLKRPPRYDGQCRNLAPAVAAQLRAAGTPAVIRFKTPADGSTTVTDAIRGDITVQNSTIDDFIILKSDGLSLYHLAAMADDHAMGITHVIRADEWLPSLPKHALILRAFGWPEPVWCHLSVFRKPSGKGKMSKRDAAELRGSEGHSIFVHELREIGYLPAAVLNWLALMGWSYDDQKEDFDMAELVRCFSLARVNPAAAAVNFEKLDHFQGVHLRRMLPQELAAALVPYFMAAGLPADPSLLERIVPLIQERITTFEDAPPLAGFFFRESVDCNSADLLVKDKTAGESAVVLQRAHAVLAALPTAQHRAANAALAALAAELELKPGQLFSPLRMAVTGQKVSPPLFETMELLGRDVVLARISAATQLLLAD